MKNKLFLFLAIIALMASVVAFDYGDAQAVSTAKTTSTTDPVNPLFVRVGCRCACPTDGDWDSDMQEAPPNAAPVEVFEDCDVAGPPSCRIYAHAKSWRANPTMSIPWQAFVADSMKVSRQCQRAWGKGEGDEKQLLQMYDTLHVTADLVGNTLTIHTVGHAELCVYTDAIAWGNLKVIVYQRRGRLGHARIYYGDISFWGGPSPSCQDHISRSGSWGGAGEVTCTIDANDCLQVNINVTDDITYNGHPDSLEVWACGPVESTSVPTLTQWGLIILVALLIASTVFVLLKRRKPVVTLR